LSGRNPIHVNAYNITKKEVRVRIMLFDFVHIWNKTIILQIISQGIQNKKNKKRKLLELVTLLRYAGVPINMTCISHPIMPSFTINKLIRSDFCKA
jgi:hypothetical protein